MKNLPILRALPALLGRADKPADKPAEIPADALLGGDWPKYLTGELVWSLALDISVYGTAYLRITSSGAERIPPVAVHLNPARCDPTPDGDP